MTSLDTLSAFGTELSGEQLNDVDGGFVGLVIGGLIVLNILIWGAVAAQ